MVVRLTVAGRIGLERDGAVTAHDRLGRPGRLMLAYLACERGRPVARHELAELLWRDDQPRSAEQMLRGLVFKLRGALREVGLDPVRVLETAGGTYQLHLPADVSIDIEEAADALERARGALLAGDPATARAEASGAAAVAARQFAPGTSGVWVEQRQVELGELHLQALEVVAQPAWPRPTGPSPSPQPSRRSRSSPSASPPI